MSEDLDPLTTETAKPLKAATLLTMTVLVFIMAAAGFLFRGRIYGAGVLVGGVLSYVNFFWLDRSTRAIFEPHAAATAGFVAFKFIARYFAVGLVLLAIYMSDAL